MRKTILSIVLSVMLIAVLIMSTAFAEETPDGDEISKRDLLPKWLDFGIDPDYDLWTALEYQADGLSETIIPTICANQELSEFEVLAKYTDDEKSVVNLVDGALQLTYDRTGHLEAFAVDIVSKALEMNVWLSKEESEGLFFDPSLLDVGSPNLITGAYDFDFVRSNPHLNGLATSVNDPKLIAYEQPNEAHGRVETIEYDTYFYALDAQKHGDMMGHFTPVKKTAYVYLPSGYDDTKQYDILYLLHGGGDTATRWFTQMNDEDFAEMGEGYAVHILDNLIANGEAKPCIVVTPGMYDVEGMDEADLFADSFTGGFRYELRDLMRVVEEKYSTYAESVSDEGLAASRDHRAMAGLSMGSITTWLSGLEGSLDVISWFGFMSAGPEPEAMSASDYVNQILVPIFQNAEAEGLKINMLLNMNGALDMSIEPHVDAFRTLTEYAKTTSYLNIGENLDFISSTSSHCWYAWNLYLLDMMQVFFQ